MITAPVVLFVYNRPWHTRQTIEALLKNNLADESDLFIFSDGPKNETDIVQINLVRAYIKTVSGFKSTTIIERPVNYGLSHSIIEGVTDIIKKSNRVIVMEDDLVTSPYFLKFLNDGLSLYENNPEVISVQGYVVPLKGNLPDYFFLIGADNQGWATWKRAWDLFEPDGKILLKQLKEKKLFIKFDFNNTYPFVKMLKDQINGKISSWAIRWVATAYTNNKYILYPSKTLVYNIGYDNLGTNTTSSNWGQLFNSEIYPYPINLEKIPIVENKNAREAFENFYKKMHPPLPVRIIRKISRLWNKIN